MADPQLDRRSFLKTSVAGALALRTLDVAGKARAHTTEGPFAEGKASIEKDARSIYRSDLSRCGPAEAAATTYVKDRWQFIRYETVWGLKGVMAVANPDDRCSPLELPLDVSGRYQVFLGINYTYAPYVEWSSSGQLEVRLTRDAGYERIAAESGSSYPDGRRKLAEGQELYKSIQETYWRTADLTGQALHLRQPQAPFNGPLDRNYANLSYVRLVPLDGAESSACDAARPTPESRRGAVFYIGPLPGSTSGSPAFHPTDPQFFVDEFEPYRDSDIGIFVFEAMRGNYCLFRSKIGDVGPEGNQWDERWVDPLAAFTALAHRHGIRIFASLRMIGPQYPMNHAPVAAARAYWRHPEWTKRDREGIPVSNLSLAYPGVRQYWLSLLREALGYGIDGLHLHLNRGFPFVLYETPVVRDFQAQFGVDPRTLPESDPRWISHSAGYVTRFVREVRALVDERPGRELGVTVTGPTRSGAEEVRETKSRACDVETWLRERLVDYVVPSTKIDHDVLRRWRALGGEQVHLWPDLMPRFQPAESYVRLATGYYGAGADGFALWDGNVRPPHATEWAVVRRLGHREQLSELLAEARQWYRSVPLKTLGEFSVEDSFRDG